ncbi:MAG: Nudix family hydrolase [Sedimenticola sp.]|nr:Nudix family hydrolase [Sedimenticola sp.]
MIIPVAVAVIQDGRGRVLLTRRAQGSHQGGLWEFPGGKLEPGESLAQALKREIREELGIEVSAHQPLITINHDYTDRRVRLEVHRVLDYQGVPSGLEGQPLAWVSPSDLKHYPMPAADRPVCNALRLPETYMITGDNADNLERFLAQLADAIDRGERLVQLRVPGLEDDRYRELARVVQHYCAERSVTLLLNAPLSLVHDLDADGIHLNSRQLMTLSERPLTRDKWVAASCHSLEELRQALAIGVDFCVLSPVLPTASHPDAEILGWDRFEQWVDQVNVPVYALGGMTATEIQTARSRGGQGVAAIRGLWGD